MIKKMRRTLLILRKTHGFLSLRPNIDSEILAAGLQSPQDEKGAEQGFVTLSDFVSGQTPL